MKERPTYKCQELYGQIKVCKGTALLAYNLLGLRPYQVIKISERERPRNSWAEFLQKMHLESGTARCLDSACQLRVFASR
jgi:hypothetical protein